MLLHKRQITRQGRRVAGHIDNALRLYLSNRRQHLLLAARTRRIHYHNVRTHTAGQQLRQLYRSITADKFRISAFIFLSVFLGVFNRRSHNLDTINLFGMTRKIQRNRTCTTVNVHYGFLAAQRRKLQRLVIQLFGLLTVHLEEGLRGNMKAQASQAVLNRFRSVQHTSFTAHDHVRLFFVDVLHHAHKSRNIAFQPFNKHAAVRNVIAGGNDNRHHLAAVHAHASHNMAHESLACLFVIGTDVIMLHPGAHCFHNCIVRLFGNHAGIRIYNAVCCRCIAAYLQHAFGVRCRRELHLVAVTPRLRRPQHRQCL